MRNQFNKHFTLTVTTIIVVLAVFLLLMHHLGGFHMPWIKALMKVLHM